MIFLTITRDYHSKRKKDWSYDKNEIFKSSKDQRKKMVYQYTLDDISIACFSSIAEASKAKGEFYPV